MPSPEPPSAEPPSPYAQHLDRTAANHVPLSPLSFLARTASVFPDHTAVIHGRIRRSWAETHERCRRVAASLAALGVGTDDTVAVMAPNIPELFEAHLAVPMTGGVLNALNTRLDAATIAFILDHGEAKVLITDTGIAHRRRGGAGAMPLPADRSSTSRMPRGRAAPGWATRTYEDLVAGGDPAIRLVAARRRMERRSPSTTPRARPATRRASSTHHRGAYLNAVGNVSDLGHAPPPGLSLDAADVPLQRLVLSLDHHRARRHHVCLRRVEAKAIYDAIADHGSPICAVRRS